MNEIIVGVDGSDESRHALRWAVEEGRLRKAPVRAIHAWELPLIPTDVGLVPPRPDVVTELTSFAEGAQRLVGTLVEEVVGDAQDVAVDAVAIEGKPAQVLLDVAEEGAQMIVVGSRGHGGFTALLLGSVSEQVARHAPCPVVIHRRRRDT
jgi:nucleotide-binding universal stress UspA family protein